MLCVYDLASTPARLMSDILATHPFAVINGRLRANPYAVDPDVDYFAVGPVHETPTKPGRPAAGLAYVAHAAGAATKPWFAIGGIDTTTIGPVLEGGARRIVGFTKEHLREPFARFFYSERIDSGGAAHVIDKNLALLSAAGIGDRRVSFPMALPAST